MNSRLVLLLSHLRLSGSCKLAILQSNWKLKSLAAYKSSLLHLLQNRLSYITTENK